MEDEEDNAAASSTVPAIPPPFPLDFGFSGGCGEEAGEPPSSWRSGRGEEGGEETGKGKVVMEGREMCWDGCGRPLKVCICPHLPPEPVATATRVLILHHPHELRQKLSTVPVLTRCLLNCHTLPGRRLRLGSSPLLDSLHHHHLLHTTTTSNSSSQALFLFPSTATGDADDDDDADDLARYKGRCRVLIVLDGTWKHAREMMRASLPFLSRFARRVSLAGGCHVNADGDSMFESDLVLRKEPYRGCLSTMEAVARALRVLEPDQGAEVEGILLSVLRAMVRLQARHLMDKTVKPRPRLSRKMKKNEEEEGER